LQEKDLQQVIQQRTFIAVNDLPHSLSLSIQRQICQTIRLAIELSPNMPKQHLNTHTLQRLNFTDQLLKVGPVDHLATLCRLPAIDLPLENPVCHTLNQILRVSLDDHRSQKISQLLVKYLTRNPQSTQTSLKLSDLVGINFWQLARVVVRGALADENTERRARGGVLSTVGAAGAVDGDDDLIYVGVEIEAMGARRAVGAGEDCQVFRFEVVSLAFDVSRIWVGTVTVRDVKEAGWILQRRSTGRMIAAKAH
ncbi:hypothetical protein N431DRAFT_507804, partial [Stipitochalara longipes BDJ]